MLGSHDSPTLLLRKTRFSSSAALLQYAPLGQFTAACLSLLVFEHQSQLDSQTDVGASWRMPAYVLDESGLVQSRDRLLWHDRVVPMTTMDGDKVRTSPTQFSDYFQIIS